MSVLFEYCLTDNQRQIVELVEVQGLPKRQAAAELGIDPANLRKSLRSVKHRAAQAGYAPDHDMVHVVPDGFTVSGVSTYYNDEGKPTGQWVKSKQDAERRVELMIERIEQACENVQPFEPTSTPEICDERLCTVLTITDYHLGMKASQESEGNNWDAKIARDTFLNAIYDMLHASPASKTGILAQLGDWLHWDGILPVTPQSKHVLIGTDDRYAKLVDITIQVMDEAVKMMLEKFGHVVIVQAEGNHDISTMQIASISRLRPVMLAAVTTIFGMSPLLTDDFFREMAVCIMGGLSFATLITLVAVPVFYRIALGRRISH